MKASTAEDRGREVAWLVVCQSLGPAFRAMLESMTAVLGPCLLITGTPCGPSGNGVTVRQSVAYNRRSILARSVSWMAFAAVAFGVLVRRAAERPVLVVSNPPFLPHVVLLASLFRRFPFHLLLWDLYPEHLVAAGLCGQGNLLARSWRVLNRLACSRAETVLTLSGGMAETIRANWMRGEDRGKVVVIPLWIPTPAAASWDHAQREVSRADKANEPIVLLYAGNIGASHDLGAILDAAESLREDARFKIMIVGDGLGRPALEERVLGGKLHNVVIADRQDEQTFGKLLAAADLAIVAQARDTENLSFPSKLLTALGAGLGVIALTRRDGELGRLIEQNKCGLAFEPGEGVELAEALVGLYCNPNELQAMREQSRRLGREAFAFDSARRDLLKVFRRD